MSETYFYFSTCQDHKLIECLSQYPCLYDSNMAYKQKDLFERKDAWEDVSQNVGRTVPDCKKRWRNIRDTFYKHQKSLKERAGWKSKWSLLEKLDFLSTTPCKKRTRKNSSNEDEANRNDSFESENGDGQDSFINNLAPTTRPVEKNVSREKKSEFLKKGSTNEKTLNTPKKRSDEQSEKVEVLKKQRIPSDDESDPVLIFFKSMALTVRNLEPELIVEAKSRILAIVSELEMRSLQST